jgi:hypothetical protein
MLTEMQENFAAQQGIIMETCDYTLAHNIIFSAVDFAASVRIEPVREFATTEMILEPDDDDKIALMDIECGKDGKPFLMTDPSDPRRSYYLRQLEQYAGEGNYEFFQDADDLDQEEDDDDDNDDDDPDYDSVFAELQNWSHEDWEDFILDGPEEDAEPDEPTTVYIYQKTIHQPEAAARNLDTDKLMATLTRGITYEPIVNRSYGNDAEENKTAEEIHSILFRGNPTAREIRTVIPRIQEGMKRWPASPVFQNYLYNAYIILEEKSKADSALATLKQQFPDYLFGKVAYAQKLLQTGQSDKIPALFGGHSDLSSLYPKRDSFHLSEFITFMTIYCFYYLDKGDDLMAGIYGTALKQWAVDPIAEFTTDVLNMLDMKLQIKVLRKLSEAGEDEVKREQLIALLMR